MHVFKLMPSSPTRCKRTAKVKSGPELQQYDNSYFRYASDEVLYNDLYTYVSKKDILLSPDSYRPKTNCFNCVV